VISLKDIGWLNVARALTELNPPHGGARVAAVIVYKNGFVSRGVNMNKTHPFQARFAKNEHAITMHAEIAAIHAALKVLSLKELRQATMYIARRKLEFKGSKVFVDALARPCDGCMRAIVEFGLKRVVYTGDTWTSELFR
jgi:tRNA(Arg) A34 adenosine deaminase TadA